MKRKFTIEEAINNLTSFNDNNINYGISTLHPNCSQEEYRNKVKLKYNEYLSMIGKCYHVKNDMFLKSNFSIFKIENITDRSFIVSGFEYITKEVDENSGELLLTLVNTQIPFFHSTSPTQTWMEIPKSKIDKVNNLLTETLNELKTIK